jgi:hypothetical protein
MRLIILLTLYTLPLVLRATGDSVAYTHDYEFREGIFLTVEQFKQNKPIKKSDIISSVPAGQVDFMNEVMSHKIVTYRDSTGKEQQLESSTVWGYCQNRNIYMNFNNDFNRISMVGTVCHLVATITTYSSYHDPMNLNYAINNSYDELRQFVFDTRTNKVLDFNVKNMEMILESDKELHAEFMKLSKRKKADSIFVFLRRFNAKHPLYLPG